MALPALTIRFFYRPLPVERGETHAAVRCLRARGHCVTETDDEPVDAAGVDVVWLQSNPNLYPRALTSLRRMPLPQRPFTLLWFSEPLPMPSAAGLRPARLTARERLKRLLRDPRATDVYSNAAALRKLQEQQIPHLLLVSTPARRAYLAEQELVSECVPLGYDAERDGMDRRGERDIDVLFLGQRVPRRRRLIRQLQARGIRVEVRGSWFDPDCWGEPRTRLLNRTRIFLNLVRHPGELPGYRMILGMANGCLVISEPIHAPGPYVPGRHFVECRAERMAEVIKAFLDNETERQRIATEGRLLVTTTLTQARSVDRILDLLAQHPRFASGFPTRPPTRGPPG